MSYAIAYLPYPLPGSVQAHTRKQFLAQAIMTTLLAAIEEKLEKISLAATDPLEERLQYQHLLDKLLHHIGRSEDMYTADTRAQLLQFRDEYLFRQFAGNMNWGKAKKLYRPDIDAQQSSRDQLAVLFPLPVHLVVPVTHTREALPACLAGISTLSGRRTLRRLLHTPSPAP